MPRMKLTLFACLIFVTLMLAVSVRTRADTIVFTDRDAFGAAAANLSLLDFEGIAPIDSVANFSGPLTLQGVTFSGAPSGDVSVVDSGFFRPLFEFNSGAVLSGFSYIEVVLPAGVTAVGTDLMGTNPSGAFFDVVLASGETFTFSTPQAPARGFAGFISAQGITTIRFTPVADQSGSRSIPLIDNFRFGEAATTDPVPEPATLLLLGTGLVGIIREIKRRR